MITCTSSPPPQYSTLRSSQVGPLVLSRLQPGMLRRPEMGAYGGPPQRLPPFSAFNLPEESDERSPRRLATLFTRKRDVSGLFDTQAPVVIPLPEQSAIFTPFTGDTPSVKKLSPEVKKPKPKRVRLQTEQRREQCRTSQARYRSRQRDFVDDLKENVQSLRDEVQSLSVQHHTICYGVHTQLNVWSFAAEYFRLLRYGLLQPMDAVEGTTEASPTSSHPPTLRDQEKFLRAAVSPHVAFGDMNGVNALLEQWRRYSTYFGNLHLKLLRMEEQPSHGALTTSAVLSITVKETTLRFVFPHLLGLTVSGSGDLSLCARLLGQRLECRCSLRFLWDDSTGQLARLDSTMDLVTPLLRVLGNLHDVSLVLEKAHISPNYLIADLERAAGDEYR